MPSATGRCSCSPSWFSVASIIVITQARGWNLLAVGETWAGSRGADLRRLTIIGYCCGSVLTAGAIALDRPHRIRGADCSPFGAVPHQP